MMQRRVRTASADTATTAASRFGLVFVVLMLVAAVSALTVATMQARSSKRDYGVRDRLAARDASRFLAEHMTERRTEQHAFLSANRDAFLSEDRAALQARIEDRYLELAPLDVIGVAVTDASGAIVVVAERTPGVLGDGASQRSVTRIARDAVRQGDAITTGRLRRDGVSMVGDARSLSDFAARYGSWVVFYDMSSGPVGTYIAHDSDQALPVVTVRDARGRIVVGPRDLSAQDVSGIPDDAISRAVPATSWRIVVPPTPIPVGIPIWVYGALVIGIVFLGLVYWVQEFARRQARIDARSSARETQRLYALAADLLQSRSSSEQGQLLASAMYSAAELAAVRVRIAADRDPGGIVVGEESSHHDLRSYRLAITGPGAPLGEVVLYAAGTPVNVHARGIARTMAALTGAAMHTLSVIDREREAAEELQRVDELRTNLMSTIAHELRSPLTAVKGVLGLLSMQSDLPDKAQQYVGVATERTDALVALIRDLFDVSLLESGQLVVRTERRIASELLDTSLGAVAAAHPGELVLSATPQLPITVDPLRFDQIVNNIVTNAFRHGRPPIEVAVRPYRDGVCVVITDDGPGIHHDERQRIFSKFYQSDSGHARLVEGAGIGLSLVHGLVALHGGWIEVDSVHLDGRGARFTIFFPDVQPRVEELDVRDAG